MSHFSRSIGPFLVGLVVGSSLFLTSAYWLPETETLVRILVAVAGLLLAILLVVWFAYRLFVSNLSEIDYEALRETWSFLRNDPRLFFKREFWSEHLVPQLSLAGPAIGAWFAYSAALGFVTLVLTNILLLATLLVQLLSAERLATQNDLLGFQNDLLTDHGVFLQTQARIDANRLFQEEVARRQLYDRRWGELHAYLLGEYGHVENGEFVPALIGTACARPPNDCSQRANLTEMSLPARLVRERLAERKESFLDALETAAIRDPEIARDSNISDVLVALRMASNDCFGKEEFTLGVVEGLEALLKLEFAASALENSRVSAPGELDTFGLSATNDLSKAYVDFRRRFFDQKLVGFSWEEFPDAFADAVGRLHTDIRGVMEYCELALRDSDALIEELRGFLVTTAPTIVEGEN